MIISRRKNEDVRVSVLYPFLQHRYSTSISYHMRNVGTLLLLCEEKNKKKVKSIIIPYLMETGNTYDQFILLQAEGLIKY
jgi:hypothetical protein